VHARRPLSGETTAAGSPHTQDSIQELPRKKTQQARPTREEILEGIGYTPLTFPASLHVPEALRAKEERGPIGIKCTEM